MKASAKSTNKTKEVVGTGDTLDLPLTRNVASLIFMLEFPSKDPASFMDNFVYLVKKEQRFFERKSQLTIELTVERSLTDMRVREGWDVAEKGKYTETGIAQEVASTPEIRRLTDALREVELEHRYISTVLTFMRLKYEQSLKYTTEVIK